MEQESLGRHDGLWRNLPVFGELPEEGGGGEDRNKGTIE